MTAPAATTSRSTVALHGLVVGLAVGLAVVAAWIPATTCEDEGFSCLGTVVVTIFATPVLAFVVGLIVGILLHDQRPWLIALLGPFAAYGVLRTSVSLLDLGVASLVVTAVLVALAYAGIALLLRPRTSLWLRVVAVVVVAAMIFGPGLVEAANDSVMLPIS